MSSAGAQAHGNSVEGSRQQGEIRLGEFPSPPEQARGDKEISIRENRTPEPRTVSYGAEFRHRDRMRQGGGDGYGRKRGLAAATGPRFPL
jgi:hypothetical protein